MGQYWLPVNLDKKEYIDPHQLGAGLKMWEQLANWPGTGAALVLLCAAQRERRGGGDLDQTDNWHGPERQFPRDNMNPGPMPEEYAEVAARTIGRWAGDRIALVGDYAEDDDMPNIPHFGQIYHLCMDNVAAVDELTTLTEEVEKTTTQERAAELIERATAIASGLYRDITPDVCRVLEHELNGKFVGDGWRDFKRDKDNG